MARPTLANLQAQLAETQNKLQEAMQLKLQAENFATSIKAKLKAVEDELEKKAQQLNILQENLVDRAQVMAENKPYKLFALCFGAGAAFAFMLTTLF